MKEESHWNVHSLYDLLYFNCPSCAYKNPVKQEFVDHAYQLHPESEQYLRKISDGSLSDVEIPSYYDQDEMKFDIVKVEDESQVENKENLALDPLDFENPKTSSWKEKKAKIVHSFDADVAYSNDNTLSQNEIIQDNFNEEKYHEENSALDPLDFENLKPFRCKKKKGKIPTCKICSKSFFTLRYLSHHMDSIHKGLKPYKCESCGKSFTRAQYLKNHINKIHYGHNDYKCAF